MPRTSRNPDRLIQQLGTAVLLALGLFSGTAHAQRILVGQKSADGQFSFLAGDELLINQNRKIKLADNDRAVSAGKAKTLERIEISQAGVLRGDGKGGVFRGSGESRQRVLPEGFASKEGFNVSTLDVELTLTVVKDKKSKNVAEVPAKLFYVYIPDVEPDHAAKQFVMNAENFSSFDEQLSAISGFVRSFSNSSATQELRTALHSELENAVNKYDAGASYQSLLDAKKLSMLATSAFASDQAITKDAAQVEERVRSTTASVRLLQGLAGLGDWEAFLTAYEKIEIHQDSFPDLQRLHREALEEQTRAECVRGRALVLRHKDSEATQDFGNALQMDPKNGEIEKQMQAARMLAAQAEAKKNAGSWKRLPKDSPEERLFRQALYNADRAIQDHDYGKAREAIQQAERQNAEAPEILLVKASLLASGEQIAGAIPLLDRYESLVTDPSDREKGDTVRNQVGYELRKKKETSAHDIESFLSKGELTSLYTASISALKVDPTEPTFLYAAALSASILRKNDEAKTYAVSYLKYSDNLASDEAARNQARKLLSALQTTPAMETKGTPNWFSGRKVPAGAYYCPASLAFQGPIQSVGGFKFRMDYTWEQNHLSKIRSTFEDEKGRQDYYALVSMAPGGQDKKVANADLGSFSFVYGKSPAGVRSVFAGDIPNGTKVDDEVRLVKKEDGSFQLVSSSGTPEVVLENDPSLNTQLVQQVLGPVTTVISGNSFFNPFIWDGVHYFTVSYDSRGRISTAKEWNSDNLVRFSWDNDRLTQIAAFRGKEGEPFYNRAISYSGENIASEEYSSGGRNGHIKYSYSKDHLASAKVVDGGVYDGKTWTVRFY